jgi:hypothetical protein
MFFKWDATQYCINAEGRATIVKFGDHSDKPPTALIEGDHFHNANAASQVHIKPIFSSHMTNSNALQQVVCIIKHILTPKIVKSEYKRIGQRRRCNDALVQ